MNSIGSSKNLTGTGNSLLGNGAIDKLRNTIQNLSKDECKELFIKKNLYSHLWPFFTDQNLADFIVILKQVFDQSFKNEADILLKRV